MKLSVYAIISSILALFYGLALLIMPVQFMQNYAISLDPGAATLARVFGSSMCGYAIIYWMSRNIPASEKSWTVLLLASIFFNVATFIIVLKAVLDGIGNSKSWSTVALSAILTLASTYFIFKKSDVKQAQAS